MPRLDDPNVPLLILGGHWRALPQSTPPRRSRVRKPPQPRPAGLSPHVLTVPEVMAWLGCGRSRVFELLADGDITRADMPGKATLVTIASVDAYGGRHRVTPPKKAPHKPAKAPTAADLAARRADLQARRERLERRR